MAYSETPYTIEGAAGNEQFPINGEDILTIVESALTHPTHADGFVDEGDPVICGAICGIALKSAAAATDMIPIKRTGVWSLTVTAQNGQGNSNVAVGEVAYLDTSTCVISKIVTGRPFGIFLNSMTGSATPGILPVLVEPDLSTFILDDLTARVVALEGA